MSNVILKITRCSFVWKNLNSKMQTKLSTAKRFDVASWTHQQIAQSTDLRVQNRWHFHLEIMRKKKSRDPVIKEQKFIIVINVGRRSRGRGVKLFKWELRGRGVACKTTLQHTNKKTWADRKRKKKTKNAADPNGRSQDGNFLRPRLASGWIYSRPCLFKSS